MGAVLSLGLTNKYFTSFEFNDSSNGLLLETPGLTETE